MSQQIDLKKIINTTIGTKLSLVIIAGAAILAVLIINWANCSFELPDFTFLFSPIFKPPVEIEGVAPFVSVEEFQEYVEKSQSALGYYAVSLGGVRAPGLAIDESATLEVSIPKNGGGGEIAERVSETTVQVLGIDEPDIVKTDGSQIYFSSGQSHYWTRWIEIVPPQMMGETKVIKAFPPADLEVLSKINLRGDLLLHDDVLIIFGGDKIYGYNISEAENPNKKWTMELDDNNYVVAARLYQDKIYLVTRASINTFRPCPIKPLTVEGKTLTIACTDIYHPIANVPVDVTYNAVIVDVFSGRAEKAVSFVGSTDSSVVYMSQGGLYITYSYYESIVRFYSRFFKERFRDIIPGSVINKLDQLEGYDISDTAKLTEFNIILEQHYTSLSGDERLRVENELANRMGDYYKAHKRELETTGIVKIGLDDFEIKASGTVPGKPLNQFSLDEYEGNLRIAQTVGEGIFRWGIGISGQSANDVYVLDGDLKIAGSVKDLGLEERIYSARFIQDKGYLVTFRQIDPFYVLDLSDPKNPQLKGELKIPGYSSYLHPITKDKILGIGKEGSRVKISLFDVSDPENPAEKAKYTLDEYWSDILNTHHAFLLDTKHQIFFLPGSRGGYVFGYRGDNLELLRAVSDVMARRAVYLEDFLYIIGDDEIVVLNELNWEQVNELEF